VSRSCSRRDFLRVALLGATGAALTACMPQMVEVTKVVEVEKVVKEAVEVEKEVTRIVERPAAPEKKVVRILMASWAVGEIPFDTTAREFSDAHDDIEVRIQTTFEGWDTKVRAQQAEGKLEWCAGGIASSGSSSLPRWILSGLIQPMDPYIETSQQEGADRMLEDMIPTLRTVSTYQGEFYGLPYSFENITFNWRTDYFAAVGARVAGHLGRPAGHRPRAEKVGRGRADLPDVVHPRPGRLGGRDDLLRPRCAIHRGDAAQVGVV